MFLMFSANLPLEKKQQQQQKPCNNVFYLNAKKLFFSELLGWKYLTKQQIMEWRIFYDGL